jgi:hypothetical protein
MQEERRNRAGVRFDTEVVYVLRAQGASDVTATMFAAADLVAASFRPRR